MEMSDVRPQSEQKRQNRSRRLRIIDVIAFGLSISREIDNAAVVPELQQAFADIDDVDLDSSLRRRIRSQQKDSQDAMLSLGFVTALCLQAR